MVVEYCNGDTLANQIMQRKKIPESEAIEILKQIILGISVIYRLSSGYAQGEYYPSRSQV